MNSFYKLFLTFLIISIIGYIAEIVYCYILSKKITNRGFFNGPYCPIYGFGGLIVIIFLGKYNKDPLILFLLSMILCSVLEYITSFLLEKLLGVKLWDYSKQKYNINGRVCLKNSLLFGLAGMFVIYLVHPLIIKLLDILSVKQLFIIFIVTFIIFLLDVFVSIRNSIKLKKQLTIIDRIKKEIKLSFPRKKELKIQEALKKYNSYPKHLINAFPYLKKQYEKNINILKKIFDKKK